MLKLFYILSVIMLVSGALIYADAAVIWNDWIHYAAGFLMAGVFILYGTDHSQNYKRYAASLNLPFVTGILMWLSGGVTLLSGIAVFFYEIHEGSILLTAHLIGAVVYLPSLVLHLLVKYRKK